MPPSLDCSPGLPKWKELRLRLWHSTWRYCSPVSMPIPVGSTSPTKLGAGRSDIGARTLERPCTETRRETLAIWVLVHFLYFLKHCITASDWLHAKPERGTCDFIICCTWTTRKYKPFELQYSLMIYFESSGSAFILKEYNEVPTLCKLFRCLLGGGIWAG